MIIKSPSPSLLRGRVTRAASFSRMSDHVPYMGIQMEKELQAKK